MDEVTGDGSAELLDDGSIEITFAYHNGDEAILKAKRDPSSAKGRFPFRNGTRHIAYLCAHLLQLHHYTRNDARLNPADHCSVQDAYIELGTFRIGKTDSLFTTCTGYAGGVINDDVGVPFGPFSTHQIACTYKGENGFAAAVALEEGSGALTLDDYMPHVVAGASYTQGWGGLSGVVGYDSVSEDGLARLASTSRPTTGSRFSR
jgi:hypothetical protein